MGARDFASRSTPVVGTPFWHAALVRFYPVVDSLAGRRLAALGVRTVQLRAKDLSDAEATALVREALAATPRGTTQLVVSDYSRRSTPARTMSISARRTWRRPT